MGKSARTWKEKNFLEKIRTNRGVGEYEEYKPFLKTQDFSSKGISHRVRGNLINRMYEFFSSTQYNTFLLLEDKALSSGSNIVDIREHFPMWDINTLGIIDDSFSKIKLRDRETNLEYVFTSTFMLTLMNEDIQHEVITVKYSSDLSKKSVIERLELERRYWNKLGVKWSLITNKEIESFKNRLKNIKYYRNAYHISDYGSFDELVDPNIRNSLKQRLIASDTEIIATVREFGQQNNIDQNLCMIIFKNILARKELEINENIELTNHSICKTILRRNYDVK